MTMAFQRVADFDALVPGKALFVELDEPICLVRMVDDTVKAVHDTCSHQEYPLHEGWVADNQIECSLHGSTFDLDTGQPEGLPAVAPIPVYACKVEDGGVWIDLAQQLNDAPVPRH
jgi:3-phenylpropionate/trans-cinnamate dioxygenase ferredoxin component